MRARPTNVAIWRTRCLIDAEPRQRIFSRRRKGLAALGLITGKTIGVDSTTRAANADVKSILRRDTGGSYMTHLKRPAEAEGIEAQDAAALLRIDRKRKKNRTLRMCSVDRFSPINRANMIGAKGNLRCPGRDITAENCPNYCQFLRNPLS
jgi:hypothetical protein